MLGACHSGISQSTENIYCEQYTLCRSTLTHRIHTALRRSLCIHSAEPLPPERCPLRLGQRAEDAFGATSITRTLHGLIEASIISKKPIKGKYRLTDKFVDSLKSEMTEGMPRGIFIHFPDLRIFEISGIEEWTEEELDRYT
jgi:hypothetical protein